MNGLIRDHWYRADTSDQPCLRAGCGRPQAEHVESCGEWMDPRHWFVPALRHPSRCVRCARPFGHSTHRASRANRRLWSTR